MIQAQQSAEKDGCHSINPRTQNVSQTKSQTKVFLPLVLRIRKMLRERKLMQSKYKGLRVSNKYRQPDSRRATHLLAYFAASTE